MILNFRRRTTTHYSDTKAPPQRPDGNDSVIYLVVTKMCKSMKTATPHRIPPTISTVRLRKSVELMMAWWVHRGLEMHAHWG